MRHTSQTTTSLIIACVAALVAMGGFWFLYTNIKSQSSVITSKLQAVYDETVASKRLKLNRELVASTEADRQELLSHLVSSDKIVEFIEFMEKLGTKAGSTVTLSTFSSEDDSAKAPGSVTVVNASVRVVGSWAAVMKTVGLLENLPYEASFDRVRFFARDKGWEMSFDMQTRKIK